MRGAAAGVQIQEAGPRGQLEGGRTGDRLSSASNAPRQGPGDALPALARPASRTCRQAVQGGQVLRRRHRPCRQPINLGGRRPPQRLSQLAHPPRQHLRKGSAHRCGGMWRREDGETRLGGAAQLNGRHCLGWDPSKPAIAQCCLNSSSLGVPGAANSRPRRPSPAQAPATALAAPWVPAAGRGWAPARRRGR